MNVRIGNTGTGIALLIAAGLALRCADAFADDEAATDAPAARAKALDLRPPDITRLYTRQQLDRLIAKMEAENIEEIEVEGARVPAPTFTPRVWPAIAAPFWALLHPTQAWRIFAPIPPDQARDIGNQKADTEGYLEPIGVPPGDPFKQ
jgi:hypothetical protein